MASSTKADDCDRSCLYDHVDAYLHALVNRDPASLPLSPDLVYSENDQRLAIGEGAWKTAVSLGSYQLYAADTKSGQAGFMGVLHLEGMASMLAMRLKVVDGLVTEIETIVPAETIASSNFSGFMEAPARLVTARAGYRIPLSIPEQAQRPVLEAAADSYYTGVEAGTASVVAFSDDCHRMENGIPMVNNPDFRWPGVSPSGKPVPEFAAMGCAEQFDTRIWTTDSISGRRYPLIDEEFGIVFAFTLYHQFSKAQCADVVDFGPVCPPVKVDPFSLILAEAFKLRKGRIHEMESIWAILPDNREHSQVWPESP